MLRFLNLLGFPLAMTLASMSLAQAPDYNPRQLFLDQSLSQVIVPSDISLVDPFVQDYGTSPIHDRDMVSRDLNLPLSCNYSFAVQQRIRLVCSSTLGDRTYVDFFMPELRARVPQAGTFLFDCVLPNCIELHSAEGRLVVADGVALEIEPRFTNSMVSVIQQYREFFPLICNPLENSC